MNLNLIALYFYQKILPNLNKCRSRNKQIVIHNYMHDDIGDDVIINFEHGHNNSSN